MDEHEYASHLLEPVKDGSYRCELTEDLVAQSRRDVLAGHNAAVLTLEHAAHSGMQLVNEQGEVSETVGQVLHCPVGQRAVIHERQQAVRVMTVGVS